MIAPQAPSPREASPAAATLGCHLGLPEKSSCPSQAPGPCWETRCAPHTQESLRLQTAVTSSTAASGAAAEPQPSRLRGAVLCSWGASRSSGTDGQLLSADCREDFQLQAVWEHLQGWIEAQSLLSGTRSGREIETWIQEAWSGPRGAEGRVGSSPDFGGSQGETGSIGYCLSPEGRSLEVGLMGSDGWRREAVAAPVVAKGSAPRAR